jgi:hypothetical protein
MSAPDINLTLMRLEILRHKLEDDGLYVRSNTAAAAISIINRLAAAVAYADTRAVSRAAYPHACIEDQKLRDLIDVALGPDADIPNTFRTDADWRQAIIDNRNFSEGR